MNYLPTHSSSFPSVATQWEVFLPTLIPVQVCWVLPSQRLCLVIYLASLQVLVYPFFLPQQLLKIFNSPHYRNQQLSLTYFFSTTSQFFFFSVVESFSKILISFSVFILLLCVSPCTSQQKLLSMKSPSSIIMLLNPTYTFQFLPSLNPRSLIVLVARNVLFLGLHDIRLFVLILLSVVSCS